MPDKMKDHRGKVFNDLKPELMKIIKTNAGSFTGTQLNSAILLDLYGFKLTDPEMEWVNMMYQKFVPVSDSLVYR